MSREGSSRAGDSRQMCIQWVLIFLLPLPGRVSVWKLKQESDRYVDTKILAFFLNKPFRRGWLLICTKYYVCSQAQPDQCRDKVGSSLWAGWWQCEGDPQGSEHPCSFPSPRPTRQAATPSPTSTGPERARVILQLKAMVVGRGGWKSANPSHWMKPQSTLVGLLRPNETTGRVLQTQKHKLPYKEKALFLPGGSDLRSFCSISHRNTHWVFAGLASQDDYY